MKKEKRSSKKIVPDEKFISYSEKTVNSNQNESRGANTISTPTDKFLRIGAIISAGALFLLCCFSIVRGLLPYSENGGFSLSSKYSIGMPSDWISTVSYRTAEKNFPADEAGYRSLFISDTESDGNVWLICDGEIEDYEIYTSNSSNVSVNTVCKLTVKISEVHEQYENTFRTFKEGDKITAFIYPENLSEYTDEALKNRIFTFYLTTGANENPTDKKSMEIGAYKSWSVYGCFDS